MNKILYFTLLSAAFAIQSFAQKNIDAVSIQLSGIDFFGPQTGHYFLYKNKSQNQKIYWDPALQATFFKTIHQQFQLNTSICLSGLYMPQIKKDQNYISEKESSNSLQQKLSFLAFDAGFTYSFFEKNRSILNPQATTGIGYYLQGMGSGVTSHFGLGCDIKVQGNLFFTVNSNFHYSLTNQYQSRLQHAIGLKFHLRKISKAHMKDVHQNAAAIKNIPAVDSFPLAAKPSVTETDTDKDGIIDLRDRCPYKPGKKELSGCPDSDEDGIADDQDLCPGNKGKVDQNGCPDSDDDGIIDADDKCPDVFAKTIDGCPEIVTIPTISNEDVLIARKAEAQKVREVAKKILFQPNSYSLDSSVLFALDTILNVLKRDSLLFLDIEGHTDSSGNRDKNILLSQQRADACKDYLVKQGIMESRISSVGYGDLHPIADNRIPEGRSENRRTEFLLFVSEK